MTRTAMGHERAPRTWPLGSLLWEVRWLDWELLRRPELVQSWEGRAWLLDVLLRMSACRPKPGVSQLQSMSASQGIVSARSWPAWLRSMCGRQLAPSAAGLHACCVRMSHCLSAA